MTYGFVMDVPAPIQFYDALHAELGRRTSDGVDGLLLHVARQTRGGFQIVEVWESREPFERYSAELVTPLMMRLDGQMPPATAVEEIDVRGLVLPRGGVAQ